MNRNRLESYTTNIEIFLVTGKYYDWFSSWSSRWLHFCPAYFLLAHLTKVSVCIHMHLFLIVLLALCSLQMFLIYFQSFLLWKVFICSINTVSLLLASWCDLPGTSRRCPATWSAFGAISPMHRVFGILSSMPVAFLVYQKYC